MKTVREIALTLENKPGKLSEISELLGANGINILALTVRTEGEVGTLHIIVPDPERVINILHSAGYSPTVQEILAAVAPHHPGGLNAILKPLKQAGVNVEYLYSCIGGQCASDGGTIILLAVDDLAKAHDALSREWIQLFGEELYTF
jgi:hypothetical protein